MHACRNHLLPDGWVLVCKALAEQKFQGCRHLLVGQQRGHLVQCQRGAAPEFCAAAAGWSSCCRADPVRLGCSCRVFTSQVSSHMS